MFGNLETMYYLCTVINFIKYKTMSETTSKTSIAYRPLSNSCVIKAEAKIDGIKMRLLKNDDKQQIPFSTLTIVARGKFSEGCDTVEIGDLVKIRDGSMKTRVYLKDNLNQIHLVIKDYDETITKLRTEIKSKLMLGKAELNKQALENEVELELAGKLKDMSYTITEYFQLDMIDVLGVYSPENYQ